MQCLSACLPCSLGYIPVMRRYLAKSIESWKSPESSVRRYSLSDRAAQSRRALSSRARCLAVRRCNLNDLDLRLLLAQADRVQCLAVRRCSPSDPGLRSLCVLSSRRRYPLGHRCNLSGQV